MTADPELLAERESRLAALGPRPSWWRFWSRRRWDRNRAQIMSMDVSVIGRIMRDMLREIYPARSVTVTARRPRVVARSLELRRDAFGNPLPPAVTWTED